VVHRDASAISKVGSQGTAPLPWLPPLAWVFLAPAGPACGGHGGGAEGGALWKEAIGRPPTGGVVALLRTGSRRHSRIRRPAEGGGGGGETRFVLGCRQSASHRPSVSEDLDVARSIRKRDAQNSEELFIGAPKSDLEDDILVSTTNILPSYLYPLYLSPYEYIPSSYPLW